MPKYLITATVTERFYATKEVEVEIDAASIEEAERLALSKCPDAANLSSFDAEHDDTDVDICSIELSDHGEEIDENFIPRCDKTLDMFSAA